MRFEISHDSSVITDRHAELWPSKAAMDEVIQHAISKQAGGTDASPIFVSGLSDAGSAAGVARLCTNRRPYCSVGYLRLPSILSPSCTFLASGVQASSRESLIEFLRLVPEELSLTKGVRRISVERLLQSRAEVSREDLVSAGYRLIKSEDNFRFGLGQDAESLLGHLSKKRRYNIRRQCRIVQDAGGIARYSGSPSEMDSFFELAVPLSKRTYQNKISRGISNSDYHCDWLRREAAVGAAFCAVLEMQGGPVAFQTGVIREQVYVLLELGFDRRFAEFSPGMSLLVMSAEKLIEKGVAEIDFGPGEAQYKRVLATKEDVLLSGTLFPKNLVSKLEGVSVCCLQSVEDRLRVGLGDDRLRQIKNLWRRRLSG